jgi:hypothetical protein
LVGREDPVSSQVSSVLLNEIFQKSSHVLEQNDTVRLAIPEELAQFVVIHPDGQL